MCVCICVLYHNVYRYLYPADYVCVSVLYHLGVCIHVCIYAILSRSLMLLRHEYSSSYVSKLVGHLKVEYEPIDTLTAAGL